MAIRPRFAQAILAGTKTIEFRKRSLASDVRTVFIYETVPTQLIVGEFELHEHVVAAPARLWRRFAAVAGIDAAAFDAYYAGREAGVGLTIARATVYERGVPLAELSPTPAIPQSFVYLEAAQAAQIRAGAAIRRDGCSLLPASA